MPLYLKKDDPIPSLEELNQILDADDVIDNLPENIALTKALDELDKAIANSNPE
jgi:hypothetical protein